MPIYHYKNIRDIHVQLIKLPVRANLRAIRVRLKNHHARKLLPVRVTIREIREIRIHEKKLSTSITICTRLSSLVFCRNML